MGTPYTGIPGNVSLGSAVIATVPADTDTDSAATFTVGTQKVIDYLEALRLINSNTGLPLNEGFEGVAFPPITLASGPASGWTAPSTRFGADTAWVRRTVSQLVGVGSASAPTPQTASTNSSMGLQLMFTTPSFLQFVFAVTSNANNGDHLDFFIDGVLTAQFSSTTGPAAVAGTFYTDLLQEGVHTFDWRFVRGAAVSVASERCMVDSVQVISEAAWRLDPTGTRYYVDDSMGWGGPTQIGTTTAISSAVGGNAVGRWNLIGPAANPGNVFAQINSSISPQIGIQVVSGAVAAGDFARIGLGTGWVAAKSPFAEWRAALVNVGASTVMEIGQGSMSSSALLDFAGWAIDGSVSTTGWRCRTRFGTVTDIDPGIAFVASTIYRLGVIVSTVAGISSAVFLKDGKALAGTGGVPPISITTIPTTLGSMSMVRSITAAASVQGFFERGRFMSLR